VVLLRRLLWTFLEYVYILRTRRNDINDASQLLDFRINPSFVISIV
jgi:hypothetical protein